MGDINALVEIDLIQWFLVSFILLFGVTKAIEIIGKFFNYIGKPIKWFKGKDEDHELLLKTSQNLVLLQEKSEKDDRALEMAFEVFVDEVRESFEQVHKKFEETNEMQLRRKEQSLEIQKQLTDSIRQLVESQKSNNEKISALMCGSKELLGNTIDERYARYLELGGIPQNEIDDFDDIYAAYKSLNGNHGRETKYAYVKSHLPVIPVKTELLINQK